MKEKYQLIPIENLKPYANNARTHSKDQINKIAKSIKEFGFVNPVLIDADFGIIAGHGRIEGAKKLKMKEVPCILVDHLTEAQKKAYILADNRLALDAGWNEDILKMEFESLSEMDFDLSFTGFDVSEVEAHKRQNKEKDLNDENDFWLAVTFKNEEEQEKIYNELIERGYECKIMS